MAYFAELDANNVVKRVIVANQSFIDSGAVGDPKNWIETHLDESKRKNYAGIGFTYDRAKDAFIPPKPYESWVLDEQKCKWKAPKEMPKVGKKVDYQWDESTQDWKKIK